MGQFDPLINYPLAVLALITYNRSLLFIVLAVIQPTCMSILKKNKVIIKTGIEFANNRSVVLLLTN